MGQDEQEGSVKPCGRRITQHSEVTDKDEHSRQDVTSRMWSSSYIFREIEP